MENGSSSFKEISKQSLLRLPYYLTYLKNAQAVGIVNISAPKMAAELKLNEVQVRKDLAAVSSCGGKPKTGYELKKLVSDMESFLGYDNVDEAVIVGVGSLGKALYNYKGFSDYGFNIVAGFDNKNYDEDSSKSEKPVFSSSKLRDLCKRMQIKIGIITVPEICAQSVCNELIESGVLAILNFAPVHLTAPPGIIIQDVNLASSLAVLSTHLRNAIK